MKSMSDEPSTKELSTPGGLPCREVYPGANDEQPGTFPFTRGIHARMYRERLWTRRQYAGFSSARETNRRFRYLLDEGQTGLSVAFDLPTQIGYDSDDPIALGEVGRVGVPISTLDDLDELLEGIPLERASLSMTINSTAAILLAFLVALARRRGVEPRELRGTLQNDPLKELIARRTYRFGLRASLGLATDILAHCERELPHFHPISISGYHLREAGATAPQELALTIANAIAYFESARDAGVDLDYLGRRASFFFAVHNDFFEEIAKLRAARRIWAKIARERLGIEDDLACRMRFHTQTAGSTLTVLEPENNVVRVTIQALAAVLGGTQSLHTNGLDEALGLPSAAAARTALRTQQIIAHESGVPRVVDPLGGCPLVEDLTDAMERAVEAELAEIDALGGAVAAIERGHQESLLREEAYRAQQRIEDGTTPLVGVNVFREDAYASEERGSSASEAISSPASEARDARVRPERLDPNLERRRVEELGRAKSRRDLDRAGASLEALRLAARAAAGAQRSAHGERSRSARTNLVPVLIDAAEAGATLGEMSRVLAEVLGEHRA